MSSPFLAIAGIFGAHSFILRFVGLKSFKEGCQAFLMLVVSVGEVGTNGLGRLVVYALKNLAFASEILTRSTSRS